MTRWETARYTDLMPDGKARQFTFVMDAKSVITSPSGGDTLRGAGVYEISGLAWSGRGAIRRVDVTTDGGVTWSPAELQSPVLPRAHTRFRWSWRWDGREALLASRCEDETGIRPAAPPGSRQRARRQLRLSPERHPGLESRRDRRGDQRQCVRAVAAWILVRGRPCALQTLACPSHNSALDAHPTADEIKASDVDVLPDGRGLPPGSGTR